jgi:hypothetical protein
MRKRTALALAGVTALAALTAGAATYPLAARRAHVLRSGDARGVARALPALSARVERATAAVNEIDLPKLTIVAGARAPRKTAPVASPANTPAAAPCRPEWHSLETGPSARQVRSLCPSELEGGVPPAISAPERAGGTASNGLLRLEVPHAFMNDHLVDPKAPVP